MDQIPSGAIPEDQFVPDQAQGAQPSPGAQQVPPGAIPVEDFKSDQDTAGGVVGGAAAGAEQLVSGATLGLSKKLETATGLTTPEDIAAREAAHPYVSGIANFLGTGALLYGTGGLSGLAEGAGLAAKVGVGALEGAGIGGVTQATDEWSQNKPLDAQKIAANAGLGALFGAAGAGIGEGIKAKYGSKIAPVANDVADQAETVEANTPSGPGDPPSGGAPVVDSPEVQTGKMGVTETNYEDIAKKVKDARFSGNAIEMPQAAELEDAASRVPMDNPVNPLQVDSVKTQAGRDAYSTFKEMPGETGESLQGYESLQKNELVNKTQQAIESVAPDYTPTADAQEAGSRVADAFTNTLETRQKELGQAIGELKGTPVEDVDHLPGIIDNLTDPEASQYANPKIANMFDLNGEEVGFKPWDAQMGIAKKTYQNIKAAIKSMQDNNPDVEGLFNIRKALDDGVNVMEKGGAGNEISRAKAAMMDYIQEAVQSVEPDSPVRQTFANYAQNSQAIEFVEKQLGARVGDNNWRSLAAGKPEENILGKIFSNSETTAAAKKILPPKDFNRALADYLNIKKQGLHAEGKGGFSSNKWGSFLRKNQYALKEAFADNPETLQRLNDMTTIMRILPDAPSSNPSGTSKTLVRALLGMKMHDMTWEGLLASVPQKIGQAIEKQIQLGELNKALAGRAVNNSASQSMQDGVGRITRRMENGIRSAFQSPAGVTRKAQ